MRVVENEILDMDEFTGNPHAGSRVEEMPSLDKAGANRTTPRPLVEPGQLIFCCRFYFPISIARTSYAG